MATKKKHVRLFCYCGADKNQLCRNFEHPYTDKLYGFNNGLFIDLTKFKGPADFYKRKTITEFDLTIKPQL